MWTQHSTLAVHIRHWDWEEVDWQKLLEQRLGMSPTQIQVCMWHLSLCMYLRACVCPAENMRVTTAPSLGSPSPLPAAEPEQIP